MTDYTANVSADFSGYTTSVQQAIAQTRQFAKANEGLTGVIGKVGTKTITKFTDVLGLQSKAMKANVAEASNYQQVLGKVSANAVAAGKSFTEVQKASKDIARNLTGSIGSGSGAVEASQGILGTASVKRIKEMSKTMVELGAATGESGTEIGTSLAQISRSYGMLPDPERISSLGDSLIATSAKFGTSASAVAGFSKEIAPFAKQIGLAQTSVIGLSTSFAKIGEEGYRGANIANKVFADIDAAVREGAPTLGVYAETLGKTYDETLKLAKASPKEFFVQFIEALDKQGTGAIRTLEQLGFEGVRTQKVLKDLASGGQLREQIATAEEAYGSGISTESAEQVMSGLNEESAKLQESLRQVVANGGEPFLAWMEKVTSMGRGMADVLAKVTDSKLFDVITSGAVATSVTAGIGAAGIGAALKFGNLGAGIGMINDITGGRLGDFREFVGQNKKLAVGAGVGGLALGQLTGNPTMTTVGLASIAASAFADDKVFSAMKTMFEFSFTDALEALNVPFTDWGKAPMGREARMASAVEFNPAFNRFNPTGSQDQFATIAKAIKDSDEYDKEDLKAFKTMARSLDSSGRVLPEAATLIAEANDELKKTERLPADLMSRIDTVLENAPLQDPKRRLKSYGRRAGEMAEDFMSGSLTQLSAIGPFLAKLGTPALLAGGVGLTAGAAYWTKKKIDERQENLESDTLTQREQVAEKYGLVAPVFDGISVAGNKLTSTFEQLSVSVGKMLDNGTGEVKLSSSEYAKVEAPEEPSVDFDFQNYRVGWQTVGKQQTGTQAMSELIAAYGSAPNSDSVAALISDLKAKGNSVEETNAAVSKYLEVTASDDAVLKNTFEDYIQQKEKGFWEEETWDDALKNWQADSKLSDSQQLQLVLDQMEKVAPQMTTQELAEMWNRVSTALNMEGVQGPGFKGGVRGPNDNYNNAAAAYAGTGSQYYGAYAVSYTPPKEGEEKPEPPTNEERSAATLSSLYGREIGDFEASVKSMFAVAPDSELGRAMFRIGREDSGAVDVNASPGSYEWTQQQGVDRSKDDAIRATTEILHTAYQEFLQGDSAGNTQRSAAVAGSVVATSGSVQKGLEELQAMALRVSPDSAMGQTLGLAMERVQSERGIEYMGMNDFDRIRAQGEDARKAKAQAQALLDSGEKSEQVQQQWLEADAAIQDNRKQEIQFMQNYLKSYRAMETQLRYSQEDYETSRGYAKEDYATQRSQAAEQYQMQQRYSTEAYNRQMRQMQEDYQTQVQRSEREYFKQRQYQADDFAKAMERRMEDLAKGMMDPFQRIAVESTWSGAGIVNNLQEQEDQMRKQIENLNKLREAGVDQGAIDLLGLNDPKKAQQLERLLGDIGAGGTDIVERLNALAASRVDIAGQLFSGENSIDTRRQEEDYLKGMQRMAEARQTFLADSEADYNKARRRAEEAFNISMQQARESYDMSMRYMAQAHQRAMDRMAEQHQKTMVRTREQFNEQFVAITSDYETLSAATTQALKEGTVEWAGVISSGTESMKRDFAKNAADLGNVWADSFVGSLEDQFGKESIVMKSMKTVLTALGAAISTGGGPGPGEAAEYEQPTNTSAAGPTFVVGGKGTYNTNNPYGKPNKGYAAGRHTGADVGAATGTTIYSTVSGEVKKAGWDGAYGNAVYVDNGGGIRMLYAHMSSVGVRAGDKVSRGTPIGRVGSTGNSFGPHVHVEARANYRKGWPGYGSDVDPRPYMFDGGIATRRVQATIGEGGYPEAVIPLNHRGIDALSQALTKAYSSSALERAVGGSKQQQVAVTYVVTEDHSVNVNGPVEVVSQDPERIHRELERVARRRALVEPSGRRR